MSKNKKDKKSKKSEKSGANGDGAAVVSVEPSPAVEDSSTPLSKKKRKKSTRSEGVPLSTSLSELSVNGPATTTTFGKGDALNDKKDKKAKKRKSEAVVIEDGGDDGGDEGVRDGKEKREEMVEKVKKSKKDKKEKRKSAAAVEADA